MVGGVVASASFLVRWLSLIELAHLACCPRFCSSPVNRLSPSSRRSADAGNMDFFAGDDGEANRPSWRTSELALPVTQSAIVGMLPPTSPLDNCQPMSRREMPKSIQPRCQISSDVADTVTVRIAAPVRFEERFGALYGPVAPILRCVASFWMSFWVLFPQPLPASVYNTAFSKTAMR